MNSFYRITAKFSTVTVDYTETTVECEQLGS